VAGKFSLIDLTPFKGPGVEGLMKVLTDTIVQTKAERLVIDSTTTIINMIGLENARLFFQSVLNRIIKAFGVTAILVGEIPYGGPSENASLEFIADGVIVMKNLIDDDSEKRLLQVAKMRNCRIEHGNYEYLISEKYGGVEVIALPQRFVGSRIASAHKRITTGIPKLDEMTRGGLPAGSVTLLEGPVGTGKTTLSLQILAANARNGQAGLMVSLEESVEQIRASIDAYGLGGYEELGDRLRVESFVPEVLTPLHYYQYLRELVEEHRPSVLVIDSLNPMQRSLPESDFLSLARYIQMMCQEKGISAVLTFRTPGNVSLVYDSEVTTIVDNLISMGFDEASKSEIRNQILIVKMRESPHDKRVHDYSITGRGVAVKEK
jgi:circadian clock protein KaiC